MCFTAGGQREWHIRWEEGVGLEEEGIRDVGIEKTDMFDIIQIIWYTI